MKANIITEEMIVKIAEEIAEYVQMEILSRLVNENEIAERYATRKIVCLTMLDILQLDLDIEFDYQSRTVSVTVDGHKVTRQ